MSYFTKVRIKKDTELYFDNEDNLHTFLELLFGANSSIDYIEIALSDSMEYFDKVGE